LIKKRFVEFKIDNYSLLYEKQNGICPRCNTSLGYLNERTLEIHHLKQVSKLNENNKFLKDIKNLVLLHKECHRIIKVIK